MMGSRVRIVLFMSGLLAVTAAGCGSTQGSPKDSGLGLPTSAPTATTAISSLPTSLTDPACGEVPAALEGKWSKTLSPDDLPPELFDQDTGVFVMTLGPGHRVRTDVDQDHPGVDESFCWTADQAIYVTDREDCDNASLGAYEWDVRDDTLDFIEIKDECFWRPLQTTLYAWERVRN
jgi:hypothetical protein